MPLALSLTDPSSLPPAGKPTHLVCGPRCWPGDAPWAGVEVCVVVACVLGRGDLPEASAAWRHNNPTWRLRTGGAARSLLHSHTSLLTQPGNTCVQSHTMQKPLQSTLASVHPDLCHIHPPSSLHPFLSSYANPSCPALPSCTRL
eukprot:109440-Chlamydomonas_euryale.AAC.1